MSSAPDVALPPDNPRRDSFGRPRVYLEDDCPIEEIGIECGRETSVGLHPPPHRLHVWWARRPLTISRAAVLGSLLPAGFDRNEFLRLNGILGDPVADRKRIDEANRTQTHLASGFSYKRAFSSEIPGSSTALMKGAFLETWGTESPSVLDSFAGGASIPFEGYRMGCQVVLNELNPVASVIERATLEYPARFGAGLGMDIESWGNRIASDVQRRLSQFFPKGEGEEIFAYIWVRTVTSPSCELTIPLSPNWWLDVENELGLQPIVPAAGEGNKCTFQVASKSGEFDPEVGSIKRGIAVCPRCRNPLDDQHLRTQALAGKMGHQLAGIGFKLIGRKGRMFRPPSEGDLSGVLGAEEELRRDSPRFQAHGLIPDEAVPEGNKTSGYLLNRGMTRWSLLFSPRQLLVHLVTLEAILKQPWKEVKDPKRREALRVYMALALDKSVDYNCLQSRYESTRQIVKGKFGRHDFAFVWSYGEIDGGGHLFRWCTDQVKDAYIDLVRLMPPQAAPLPTFLQGDARRLTSLATGSVAAVVIDPPYHDNVMYAELADFFYVWEKRSLGDVFPDVFRAELTDKDDEAVANAARFKSAHRGKARELAALDYEAKMAAAFAECWRVLRDDGVLTVMFTHKRVDAWDTLSSALFGAGFEITASWPVHTESQHSLHQAKKNSASSTILLVCRKRPVQAATAWWEDLQEPLDRLVLARAQSYSEKGLRGQDVFIACFGPALQVISEHWPVRTKDGKTIRPDEALDRAREAVLDWFLDHIAEGKGRTLDSQTRFYVLAWHIFGAREFPFDEARKLALSLHVDLEQLTAHRVLEKKGQDVRLLKPAERVRARGLTIDSKSFDWDLDYVQAAIESYDQGKSLELSRFHTRTGALARESYRAAVGLMLDVLPRTAEVVEYELLDQMWQSSMQGQIPRTVRLTDPTGEKQRRLEAFTEDKSADSTAGEDAEDGGEER